MAWDKNNTATLTPSEITHIIISMIIGIGILGATGPVEVAGNDAWISVLVGGLYPLYLIWLALIISKRFPKVNIITINTRLFGKYLGSLINLLISGIFIYYIIQGVASFTFITRIFIANFVPHQTITIISMLLILSLAIKELNVIAKVNVFIFFISHLLS